MMSSNALSATTGNFLDESILVINARLNSGENEPSVDDLSDVVIVKLYFDNGSIGNDGKADISKLLL